MDRLEKEANIFSRYLIGRDAGSLAVEVYKTTMATSKPNTTDRKLLNYMVSHPHSIGFIDAGLVFHNSTSEARRRLYVMLAILEASPEHCDLFLPQKRSPFYIFVIYFAGIRAVIKAIFGLLLVKVVV